MPFILVAVTASDGFIIRERERERETDRVKKEGRCIQRRRSIAFGYPLLH